MIDFIVILTEYSKDWHDSDTAAWQVYQGGLHIVCRHDTTGCDPFTVTDFGKFMTGSYDLGANTL